ncbi:MAG: class I SAM-dependent methyltransferase [Legionellales bacterium]|nr:class I SAM-dependent methyltransferase [Legionellales bacterium]
MNNLDAPNIHHHWTNYDNDPFYQSLSGEGLRTFAKKAGLVNGCDIKLLKPYWENAQSILDVTSGYGRVIHALRSQNYLGTIIGIERNQAQYESAKQYVGQDALLIHGDIHDLTVIQQKFDVILLLWSGLAEFHPSEQPLIIRNLAKKLNPNGYLIIDTIPMNVKPLGTEEFAYRSFLTRVNDSVVHTYEATYDEIELYANQANLNQIKLITVETETQRTRWLYVLSH